MTILENLSRVLYEKNIRLRVMTQTDVYFIFGETENPAFGQVVLRLALVVGFVEQSLHQFTALTLSNSSLENFVMSIALIPQHRPSGLQSFVWCLHIRDH